MSSQLILINPWIYDFAAFDLWAKPLGLLQIASFMRSAGFKVCLIDCLDIHHPGLGKRPPRHKFGTGKFIRERQKVPPQLSHVKRPYSRYGIPEEIVAKELSAVENPAAILVTSLMTYWYPGVFRAIEMAKEVHPHVPVLLGGIYAKLCKEHAERSGADVVIDRTGPEHIIPVLKNLGIDLPKSLNRSRPEQAYPAFDMLNKLDYVCIATSSGCPYRCKYCASHFLRPGFFQREPHDVMEEIVYWHYRFGVEDFAFYDDALLVSAKTHIIPILKGLEALWGKIRFHTPNAIHISKVTREVAELMYRSGFRTIRLGLETADASLHRRLDRKVKEGEFEQAVRYLLEAGFKNREIGAYILTGLPEQSIDSVANTINFVKRRRVMPYLAEYSPLPHTPLWKDAIISSEYDLESEPLYHNNTLLPCWDENRRKELPKLKAMVMEARRQLM